MIHFCWRPRTQTLSEPEIDLIMIPTDGTFSPYGDKDADVLSNGITSPTDGRIAVLKFSSSPERHLFWLQSKSQHPQGNPNWFSSRDLKLIEIVNLLLQGEDIDVMEELREINNSNNDEDQDMEDAEPRNPRLRANSTGGAGSGATGGDFREEGESNREGGADGGRA